jgi:hypothetical protein
VVIAEGDLEPRSIGSYALRVYSGRSNEFPIDEFILGVVRPRNGIVECVRFEDVDGDDRSEILVIICSVGSGYFPSDAFRYGARSLELIASVADRDKVAEPIRALRDKFKVTAESKSSTPSEMRE